MIPVETDRSKVAPDRPWRLRRLRADETDEARALSVACFGARANTEAFIRARYFHPQGPRVFVVVAEQDGRLIGQQAATLLPFRAGDSDVTVCMFTDGMTHPGYQRRGVFAHLLKATAAQAFERGACALFTMPNDESIPAFRKSATWSLFPPRYLYARVIDAGGFCRDRRLPRALGALLVPVARRPQAARWASYSVDQIDGIETVADHIDRLAGDCCRCIGGVLCRRDAAFLQWRFGENPTFSYRYFVARDAEGRIGALVITTTESRLHTTITLVVDVVWSGDDEALSAAVEYAADRGLQDGATVFGTIVTPGHLADRLRRCGLCRLPPRFVGRRFHTAIALHPDRSVVPPIMARSESWYFGLADFDTI